MNHSRQKDTPRLVEMTNDEEHRLRLEVMQFLYDVFRASLSHDYEAVQRYHWEGKEFTKIGATDSLGISNFEEAMELEKSAFERIQNGQFYIDDLHVTRIDRVTVAIFILKVRGIYLPLNREMESLRRATVVIVNTDKGLKIIHKHFSGFPISF